MTPRYIDILNQRIKNCEKKLEIYKEKKKLWISKNKYYNNPDCYGMPPWPQKEN